MSDYNKKNTITREYLAKLINRETGININKSSKIVDTFFGSISKFIVENNQVKLRLFGTFSTKQKGERVGRNPKTKQEVLIPARTVIKFKAAPTLKKRINTNVKNFKSFVFQADGLKH